MEEKLTLHKPVMELEVIEYLQAKEGGDFLDCTLGGGGHAAAILKANPDNTLVGVDRDARAIERAQKALAPFGQRAKLVHSSFSKLMDSLPGMSFSGIVADLGISSDQLAEERGFSFSDEESLDMRMDPSENTPTAAALIDTIKAQALYVLLKQGGVGTEARAISNAIIAARPMNSAAQLAEVVVSAVGHRNKDKKTHPATVVFQAIRMAVNRELNEIEALLDQVPGLVAKGGRFAAITFHSLEDRAITARLRSWQGNTPPALWPGAFSSSEALGKLLTSKGVRPAAEEVARNARARSARLRAFQF